MSKNPMILGRFNYLSYKQDSYNVIFLPFHGAYASIVARNLGKEEALAMISEFNDTIDETRKEWEERDDEEETGTEF
jgi:hypothetical protein